MLAHADSARGPQRLMLAFCEKERFVTVFEKQTPYNMKLVAWGFLEGMRM